MITLNECFVLIMKQYFFNEIAVLIKHKSLVHSKTVMTTSFYFNTIFDLTIIVLQILG